MFGHFKASNCNGKPEKEEKRILNKEHNIQKRKFCGLDDYAVHVPCKKHRDDLTKQFNDAGK